MAQEVPVGLCEVLPHDLSLVLRLSVLDRNLIGNGSHRHLTSSVRVNIKPESIFELPPHHCEVITIERLPSGVFADPFALQHLLQHGVYRRIAVFGDTNLELPSFLSNHSAAEVHIDIGHNLFLRHGEEFNINVEIPLHARYPPLDKSGYWEVKFGVPDLFMRCSVEGKSDNQSCLYMMPKINGSEPTHDKSCLENTLWDEGACWNCIQSHFCCSLIFSHFNSCDIDILFRHQLQQTFERILIHLHNFQFSNDFCVSVDTFM